MKRVFWLVALVACGEPVDKITDIKDLRVLAIQADPPEILLSPAEAPLIFDGTADAEAPAAVRFSALVVDPRGGPISYTWTFCPLESSQSCLDYESRKAGLVIADEFPVDRADIEASLDAAHTTTDVATAEQWAESPALPANQLLRPYAVADLEIPRQILVDLQAYFYLEDLFGYAAGVWPSAVLSLDKGGETLVASKRLVVGLRELATLNDFIEPFLGVRFCEAGSADEGCLSYFPKPNKNPTFGLPFYVAEGELADAPFSPWCRDVSEATIEAPCLDDDSSEDNTGIYELAAGESMRLRPSFTPESLEAYDELRTNLQTQLIEVQAKVEDPSVAWFATAGELQDEVTWPKFTKTLDTVYTAPKEVPTATDGLVVIWMVARDQRGGTAWEHFQVRIVP